MQLGPTWYRFCQHQILALSLLLSVQVMGCFSAESSGCAPSCETCCRESGYLCFSASLKGSVFMVETA